MDTLLTYENKKKAVLLLIALAVAIWLVIDALAAGQSIGSVSPPVCRCF